MRLHVPVNWTQTQYCKVNRTAEIGDFLYSHFLKYFEKSVNYDLYFSVIHIYIYIYCYLTIIFIVMLLEFKKFSLYVL